MGKRLLTVLVVLAFLSGVALTNLGGAADKQEAPKVIDLQDKLWTEHTKGPVNFQHEKHAGEYQIACDAGHHEYKDGKNTWKEGDKVEKCSKCHNEATIKGEKKLPKDKQKLNLKLAYHNNCQGCHKELKKKDKAKYGKIPTTCIMCHTKSKKK